MTDSFCFCVSLRTASLVIAWYYLIAGIIGILPMVPTLYEYITSISTTGNTGEIITRLMVVQYYFLLLLMVISCVFLINGIYKNKPNHTRLFVISGNLLLRHELFVTTLLAFTPLRKDAEIALRPMSEAHIMVLTNPYLKLINLVVAAYLILTVHSYYTKAQQKDRHGSGSNVI
nr:PREDICTED: uncharacterized protein LOC109038812 isoform X1 [Bemisia tabaci]XP_018909556.1 PREDICTED: uncharacterized protein LOC109038812 isoform X1 [Bemisia tabaci]